MDHQKDQGPYTTTIGGQEFGYTYDPKTFTMSTLTPTGSLTVNSIGTYTPGTSTIGSIPSTNTLSTNTTSVPWTINNGITTTPYSERIELNGKDADIKVNGESLMGAIKRIEERLNMLRPNPALEAEWDQLRELGDQYRKLEQELLEKKRMWETLKK